MFGIRFVVAAVLVVAAWLCAGAFSGPVRLAALVLGVLACVIIVWSVLQLVRPPMVVRLDDDGYRLGRIPGGGVRQADWHEVAGATARETERGYALVLDLGGRTSTVPLLLVAAKAVALQTEVSERLNRAHGYRKLS